MLRGKGMMRVAVRSVWLALAISAGAMIQGHEPKADHPQQGQGTAISKKARTTGRNSLPNLTLVKEELIAYHDCRCVCGCYERDLERAGGEALAFLRQYVGTHRGTPPDPPHGQKPAVVLDVDETAISNWENIRRTDFSFSRDEYLAWEKEARATAIRPVLALFRFAQAHGLATIFITGRIEADREWTVKDLDTAGYKGWTRLIMRQPDSPKLAAEFKSAERKKLKADGYLIVENIGDQESDLAGEPALRNFELPNPFYFVR